MAHWGSVLAQGMLTYCQSVGVLLCGRDEARVDVHRDDAVELTVALGGVVVEGHLVVSGGECGLGPNDLGHVELIENQDEEKDNRMRRET